MAKRKSVEAVQRSDKMKKHVVKQEVVSNDESDEQSEHVVNGVIDEEVKDAIPANIRWPNNDIQKLLTQLEAVLPKNDTLVFRNRLPKIDWDKVKFDNYNKQECQATWTAIQDQLRTQKTLGDLVEDAKHLLATKGIDTNHSKQNRVQKPKSAYMLYYTGIFHKYKQKYPDTKLPRLAQIIAEKYKSLSPDKKQGFVDRANLLKTEYNELMAKANAGYVKPQSLEQQRKPKTPFQIFLQSEAEGFEGNLEKTEIVNHFKDEWEKMTEKKKSKWIKLANEREQVYLDHLKEHHKDDPAFTMPKKSALTKGDRIILESQSGKPKKPPVNSYSLFSTEMLQGDSLAGIPPKEKMAIVAKKWKSFSEEEKRIYTDKLKVITDRYWTEFDAYLKTLPDEERRLEMTKTKAKPKTTEPKIVPHIDAREGISEEPKKASKNEVSTLQSKTKTLDGKPSEVPFKKPFDLFKSRFRNNPKSKSIKRLEPQALLEWNALSDHKKKAYEDELKSLKKVYVKNIKVFLGSLTAEDLKTLYVKLRKPELVAEDDDGSDNVSNDSSSSEEEDEDDSDTAEYDNSELY
ncbi:nucleolar transcription factor 1-A-like [Adelges cooleyi]|uniref:nucleolar transcription factor 1-A-like n=1 Tax=Adelges cooleyi TaxID=133065 RepID=UPI00217FB6FA|nr:nucleolar transcription factor 1-A-like [Adelges cooleyi]